MRRRLLVLALAGLPLACTGVPATVPDSAQLAPGALGSNGDPDVTALNLAQNAFADPGRTYGRPTDAARAAAAMEYVAGEFYVSPRWQDISASTKEQLLQGREEVRQALGVVPGTSSQLLVNRLVAAADALAAGDQAAALQLLGPPAFSTPGEQTLARLSNLPYMQMANVSTMRAANEMFPNNNDSLY